MAENNYLNPEQTQTAINHIITFFQDERDEEIGVIAAENLLDFLLENIAPDIYQKGVKETKKLIKDFQYNLDLELDLLTQK
jgi:uncharacterized protein (DUF2164 family)